MSSVGRLLTSPRSRHDGYAFCANDRYWFHPSYTDGKCPLCGEPAATGAQPMSFWARAGADRSWFGLAALALESLAMLALVLFLFFR